MPRRERRLARIRNNPKDVSFGELCWALQQYGFVIRGGKGSHHVASHPETGTTLTFVNSSPVKRVYVARALEAIEEVESYDDLQ